MFEVTFFQIPRTKLLFFRGICSIKVPRPSSTSSVLVGMKNFMRKNTLLLHTILNSQILGFGSKMTASRRLAVELSPYGFRIISVSKKMRFLSRCW